MGKIFHSCGHEDKYRPISGWPIILKGESCCAIEGFVKSVEHMSLCHPCYLQYVKDYPEDIIFSYREEEEYLNG